MTNTYYSSLSGMLAASYGLQNTSNNISNMQTPGFKRSDVFYSSLGNGSGGDLLGSGVQIGGSTTNFSAGTYLTTGNASDLAIVGQGFFVIKLKSGELVYTRDGEFGFDSHGVLIDKHSGGEVQGYDSAGNLVPIHQKGPNSAPGKASHELYLQGQFVLYEQSTKDQTDQTGPLKSKYENIKFEVETVYDTQGKAHRVQLEFRSTPDLVNNDGSLRDDGKSWDLIKISYDGAEINFDENQKIVFSNTGAGAIAERDTIKFIINGDQEIALKFGETSRGKDKYVRLEDSPILNPDGTKINVLHNDGYGVGEQIGFSFDEEGQISYQYDNGKSIKGIHVGLARFDDPDHQLIPMHDSLFKAQQGTSTRIGRANKNGFGSIQSKQVEASNVDSTMEFANIVVLQRMFQACSQIMNIDKQLLEELEGKS